ncbi:MAG: pilus assembly protein PilM [Chloroflexi bacterium]|nr:pilus assembly protein PilM [Chloroflexota bacterium]
MITLEISSNEIRLIEAKGGRVIRWASRSLEPGMFEEGVVSNPQAFGAAVKQLMDSSGIRGKEITASISGLYSVSRIVVVPNLPGAALTQAAVLEEARQVIPLSEEEMYLSWQAIAAVDGGHEALVVAVPRDVVNSEVKALRAVGINPRVLDLKGMALARAVNREQALILNIEDISFDIVVVVAGITAVIRTTAWQPQGLSPEDRAEYLAVALDLTVGFYNSHNPELPLEMTTPLFITGQMSGDPALEKELQARIGYPIQPLVPALECPPDMPVSQCAVNIGLALKGSASTRNLGQSSNSAPDINLLPQIYRPWRPSARQLFLTGAILVVIALLFPLYQLTAEAVGKTGTLKTRYNIVNNELTRRQNEIKSREPLQKFINQYHTIVDMGGGFADDLEIIYRNAGELKIKVDSITHTGATINVACEADSYIAFRDYLAALEKSGRFASPIPPPEGYPYVKSGTIKLERKAVK